MRCENQKKVVMYDNSTVQKRAERHAENKVLSKDTICITTLVD